MSKKFSSGFESRVDKTLKEALSGRQKVKPSVGYETSKLSYVLKKNYIPDWTVVQPDGQVVFIEAKGYFDPAARSKMKAVREQHPNIKIYIVFQEDNFISKRSKTRYSDWAKKNGFEYSIKTIPVRWLFGSKTPKNLLEKEIPV